MSHESIVVPKPWGHELIWAKTDRYVGKILHVRAGEALSLQYHRVKDETIMVLSGRLRFEFFAEDEPLIYRELGPREGFSHYAWPSPSHDRDRRHRRPGGVDPRARRCRAARRSLRPHR